MTQSNILKVIIIKKQIQIAKTESKTKLKKDIESENGYDVILENKENENKLEQASIKQKKIYKEKYKTI